MLIKKISRSLKKLDIYLLSSIAFLTVTFIALFEPTLNIKFAWVDDGWDIMSARNLMNYIFHLNISGILGITVERSIGRFRPGYWLWQGIISFISGNSALVQFLLHAILVFGISLIIFQFVRFFSKSNLAAVFAASLFLVIPVNTENWVRLGPAEPIMGFLLLLSLYILFTGKKVMMAIIVLFFAFLCKETAMSIAPAITIYYLALRLSGRNDPKVLRYLISSYIFSLLTLLIIFSIRTGYSNNYVFDLAGSLYRLEVYISILRMAFPIGVCFLWTYILRNFCPIISKGLKRIDRSELIQLLMVALFISFLIVQSPWIYVLNRYTLLATIAGSIFLGIELSSVLKIISKKNPKLCMVVIVLLSFCYFIYLVSNVIEERGEVVRNVHATQELQQLMKYIVDKVPKNEKIFINFKENNGTLEPIEELNWQLKLFYDFNGSEIGSVEEIRPSDKSYLIISSPTLFGSSNYFIESQLVNNNRLVEEDTIKKTDSFIVFSNPQTIAKQVVKKATGLILHGKRFTFDGIYTYYLLNDQWDFYYYK